jgi:ubiquinone/menaquinone biosynthesis C-methylase UbiE
MQDRVFKHTEAHKLEDPQRLQWLPPGTILANLQLSPGLKIADIGAGTGYFAIPLAHAVAPGGHIFAVDLQPEMLDLLRNKLGKADAPKNISLHAGDASLLPLQDHSVDLVFFANIWHEIANLDSAIREASRVAVPNGKIAILDWRDDCVPPPGPPQNHRISANRVVTFLGENGCQQVQSTHVAEFSYLVTAILKSESK